ncbi:MAG: hypothetical protein IKO32_06100 [Lachnospiraceae bacterium]|nr:hypothetical protein [Lachnospiraceae bacterium]
MRTEKFEIANVRVLHFQIDNVDYSRTNEYTMEDILLKVTENSHGTSIYLEFGSVISEENDNMLTRIINSSTDNLYLGFQYPNKNGDGIHQSVGLGCCRDFRYVHDYASTGYYIESEKSYDKIVNNIQMAIANGLEITEKDYELGMD